MSPRRTPRRVQQPHLVVLGAELRRAREVLRPAVSGSELARRLGWGQTKVSLIEVGRQTPTEDDVRAWSRATGADAAALLDARERALMRHLDVRAAARRPGGAETLQGDLQNLEAASEAIEEFQPLVIPGLAQTSAYTRALLSSPTFLAVDESVDIEETVARRASRQRRAEGRRIVVALQPAALTAVYGTTEVQTEQLDVLAERAANGDVDLVVAGGAVAILHGFELLDDAVIVETVVGIHVMADPEVVSRFRAAMAGIRGGGVSGADAVREVERASEALRERRAARGH